GLADGDQVPGLLTDSDGLARTHLDGGHVHAASVDLDVTVRNELAGLALREREPEPEHDGVRARLELAEQLLAGDADLALGAREVAPELALADPVDGSQFLLLHQTHLVLGEALATATVQSRRIGSLVGRAIGTPAHRRTHAPAHAMTRT